MPPLLLIVLALAGPHAAPADASALEKAHALTRRASGTLLDGDAAGAERLCRAALREVADFPAARLGLGHIALAREEPRAALENYTAARAGYDQLGRLLLQFEAERHSDARETVLRFEQDSAALLARLERESDAAARSEIERRLRANEMRARQLALVAPLAETEGGVVLPAELHYHLGNALFKLRDLRSAVEAWRASLAVRPDLAVVHGNLAVALVNLGRLEEARIAAAEAERLGQPLDPRLERRLE